MRVRRKGGNLREEAMAASIWIGFGLPFFFESGIEATNLVDQAPNTSSLECRGKYSPSSTVRWVLLEASHLLNPAINIASSLDAPPGERCKVASFCTANF
jgi:hypothetical protein